MKKLTKLQKILIFILVALIGLGAIGGTAYGVYTTITKVKRVVSTQGGEGDLFSSNYLELKSTANVTSDYPVKRVNYNGDSPAVYLSVCNYAQGNITKHNSKNISYTLTVTICDTTGSPITASGTYGSSNISGSTILAADFKVGEATFTNGAYTKTSEFLSGSYLSRNIYIISFPNEYSDLISFKINASTDANTKAFANHSLVGLVYTDEVVTPAVASWDHTILEDGQGNPEDYYGFNCDVTGTGSGTVKIYWAKDYLRISSLFLSKYGKTQEDGTITTEDGLEMNYVEFPVDYQSVRIQFFRTQDFTDKTWEEVKGFFDSEFTKEES